MRSTIMLVLVSSVMVSVAAADDMQTLHIN